MRQSEREKRLAALEAKAEHEQEESSPPDVALFDDEGVLVWAIFGLRWGALDRGENGGRTIYLSDVWQQGHTKDEATCPACAWQRFWKVIAARAQPMMIAMKPFVALYAEEIDEALALIDSGRVSVTHARVPRPTWMPGLYWSLQLDGGPPPDWDVGPIGAVNYAVGLWAWQKGYPRTGDWEMTELHEWRAWLAALNGTTTAPAVCP